MWLPKPMTLSLMVCLNPNTTPMLMIIIAKPTATPIVAMLTAGRDTRFLSPPSAYILRAMNSGRFIVFSYPLLLCVVFWLAKLSKSW
jgi:hypothetical protein